MSYDHFFDHFCQRYTHQPEYLQAVSELLHSIWPFYSSHPKYQQQSLLERILEPERLIRFRVCWVDDKGMVQVNRAFRIQHSSAIGPYKGGMRFHPSVNASILKFLAFEQTFKNALTSLPMGGGKGGSDFDPKGKSEGEIMRFCQALMLELYRHVGPDTDVPAGDIGVGAREVAYMAGMMKKLTNRNDCVFTGKSVSFGGSQLRPEATGYGLLYFVSAMLAQSNQHIAGKHISISGSGNVAQFAIEKAIALGGKVITASDSSGCIYDPLGFTAEKLQSLQAIKTNGGQIKEYADRVGVQFHEKRSPWFVPTDIALPCATQNELRNGDAKLLITNGVQLVAEGANMPCTAEAISLFHETGVSFAPGKAANAGGVATSGLEMSQNAQRLSWSREIVDEHLQQIMISIHSLCIEYGRDNKGWINYERGANIASFVRIADAILEQGIL
ncbi:NADP-specific glutamate dehydrogenase [Aeromonas veronii]